MAIMEIEFSYNLAYYFLVFFTCYIFTIFIVKCFIIKHSSKLHEPPSPLSLPIIGHIYLLGSILPKSFQSLSHRYGPLMKIQMGAATYVVASSANVAKEIFKTHDLNFASRFELGPIQYSIYKGTGFITAPYSSYYRFMKKLCLSKLFGGPQLERFKNIRGQEIENLLKSVSDCCIRQDTCDLSKELTTLTNSLMFRMLLSKRYPRFVEEVKEIRELTVEIMGLGAKCGVYEVFGPLKSYDLFGHGKKLTATMRRFDDVLERIMNEYEENMDEDSGGHDVMEILLETARSNVAEVDFTRNHIKHFISEILFASIDTLSAALQWTMAELINSPTIFIKLRDEINSIVDPKRVVKESDIPNLPYLHAVVKESLRLHSPTPLIFRECTKDCVVNGYNVKANTRLLINLYGIMRDPEIWKDPDEFKPERFLTNYSTSSGWDESGVGQSQFDHQMEMQGLQDFSYIPFGGGRRACFGASLGLMVMHAAIGGLTQCFDWKVKDGEKIDITIGSGFSGAMARPLVCYPILRFQSFQ